MTPLSPKNAGGASAGVVMTKRSRGAGRGRLMLHTTLAVASPPTMNVHPTGGRSANARAALVSERTRRSGGRGLAHQTRPPARAAPRTCRARASWDPSAGRPAASGARSPGCPPAAPSSQGRRAAPTPACPTGRRRRTHACPSASRRRPHRTPTHPPVDRPGAPSPVPATCTRRCR